MNKITSLFLLGCTALFFINCDNTPTSSKEIEKVVVQGRAHWIQRGDTINISNAPIIIGDIETETTENGEFEVELEPGKYRIHIQSTPYDNYRVYSDSILVSAPVEKFIVNVRSRYVDMLPLNEGKVFSYDFSEKNTQNPTIQSRMRNGKLTVEVSKVVEIDGLRTYTINEFRDYTQVITYLDDTKNDTTYHNNVAQASCSIEEDIVRGEYDKKVVIKFTEQNSTFCKALLPYSSRDAIFKYKYMDYEKVKDNYLASSVNGNQYSWYQGFGGEVGLMKYSESSYLMFSFAMTLKVEEL